MADKIRVRCDGCGRQFRVSPDLAGKNARCSCGHVIRVPHQPAGEEIARKWYYAKKGERYGPVPQSELGRLLAGGEIKPSDYVWTRGMPSWQPAETVEELRDVLPLPEEAAEEAAVLMEGAEGPAPEPEAPAPRASGVQADVPSRPTAAPAAVEEALPAEAKAGPARPQAPTAVERAPGREKLAPKAEPSRKPAAPPEAAARPAARETVGAPAPEKRAAEPQVARKEVAPAQAPSKPAEEPGRVPAGEPHYAAARAIALLLLVVGAVGAAGGVVLTVWDRLQAGGRSQGMLAIAMIFGGLILVGVSQLLGLARDMACRVCQMSATVQGVRGGLDTRE